jgi:LuxR family maltose regulon positive regulatory protein
MARYPLLIFTPARWILSCDKIFCEKLHDITSNMTKTDVLIRTKLHLPYIRPELVQRPRLQEKVAQGLHGPLTLVTAPAGFGKTTLIASSIKDCGMKAAWLSLDKKDNQTEHFLQYLIAALQAVSNTIGCEAAQLLGVSQESSPETILTSLINDLDTEDDPIILVLDDYQFLTSSAIHESMTFLLEHCPITFHLVIASRSDPPLPLSRLRARAQMVELRASDLSFTEAEAAQFLNDIMGLQLDTQAVAALEKRTEGWIAGLQMAALSMRDRKDVIGAIAEFSGTNRYILDYLLEEVLAGQPAEIQRFLLSTSILEHITAPLCDAVLERDERKKTSIRILAYLEQANIFLVPLDVERHWYRYHHLFADLLQTRLMQTYSREEINRLHTRAAKWYGRNGYAYEAIHHASLIPDDAWVERLIEQNYMEMFQRRDSASIRAWTGALSSEVILKSPKLSIHEAMSLSWIGRLDEANFLLEKTEEILQTKETTPEIKVLTGHLAYVKSRVTAMQGDFQQAIQLCLTARDHTPSGNQALLGGIGVMLGYGYFLAGDFENAAQVLSETIHSGMAVGAVNTTIGAYCVLARLYALQGQLHQAYQTYQAAEKFVHEMGGRHRGALSIVHVGFAEVLYEWNDLEAALANLKKGLAFIHFWGKADDIAMAYTIHARIQQAQGHVPAAMETIEKAVQVIRSHGVFSEARQAVETAKVRLQLEQGNRVGVNQWVNSLEDESKAGNPFRFENELAHITLARVYITQKKLEDALELLSRLAANARSAGRTGRLIEILILKVLTQHQTGVTESAVRTLEESLTLAEPGGYTRSYLDGGQPIQMLLKQWQRDAPSSSLQEFSRDLLDQFEGETPVVTTSPTSSSNIATRANQALPEPLSPRELEVLASIARGKTNAEIAQTLIVARGTVKAQAASIYRKLDVSNRTEAVARARQLGILS